MVLCSIVFSIEFFMKSFKEPDSDVVKINNINEKIRELKSQLEKDENIDMSLGNLITLANFYNVSTDYLLCRTELQKHKNQSVSDLHLNDDAVQILTDEKYNPRLLSELLTHENF